MHRFPAFSVVVLICLFYATPSKAEPAAAPSQIELTCSSASPGETGAAENSRSFVVTLNNRSGQVLSVLWPDHASELLIPGRLRVTVEDGRGGRYAFVPPASPVIPARKESFKVLVAGGRESREISLCGFRDSRYSESPCSLTGRFKVQATYEVSSTEYWDEAQNRFVRMSGAWTGAVTCDPVHLDVRD